MLLSFISVYPAGAGRREGAVKELPQRQVVAAEPRKARRRHL